MTQFNISDTFNPPENATTVLTIRDEEEEVFAPSPDPVAPPDPAEVFAYSELSRIEMPNRVPEIHRDNQQRRIRNRR